MRHPNCFPYVHFREGGKLETFAFEKNPANPEEVKFVSEPVVLNNLNYTLYETSIANVAVYFDKMPTSAHDYILRTEIMK